MYINETILKEMLDDVERQARLAKRSFARFQESEDEIKKLDRESKEYHGAVAESQGNEDYMFWKISELIKHADVLKSYMNNFDIEGEE